VSLRLSRTGTVTGHRPGTSACRRIVNNLVKLKRRKQDRWRHGGKAMWVGGKLNAHGDWVRERLAENGALTLDELCVELAERGVSCTAPKSAVFSIGLGSAIKSLQASEQRRPEIARARDLWIRRRRPFFNKVLARLIFIGETSTNTKLTKRCGWSAKGQRYCAPPSFVEDADLHRRPQIARHGRAVYRQCADEPAHLRDLDRNATRADAVAR